MKTDTSASRVVYQPETEKERRQLGELQNLVNDIDGPCLAWMSYDGGDYPDLDADASQQVLILSLPAESQPTSLLDDPAANFVAGAVVGMAVVALGE